MLPKQKQHYQTATHNPQLIPGFLYNEIDNSYLVASF